MAFGLNLSVSLEQKVNLGGYSNSASLFLSVSGITPETTEDEIDAILDGPGQLAYKKLAVKMREKMKAIRGSSNVEEGN